MKDLLAKSALLVVLLSMCAASGCTQAAPASPTLPPTQAPQAQKPVEATKAPTSPTAPSDSKATAAPATKVDFPAKGKSITFIVPFGAGGGSDVLTRILAAAMENELGVPVQVVNKPGAGSQLGITEAVMAKPDGYTIGYTGLPAAMLFYLEPERKAVFNRKSFQPLACATLTAASIVVKAGGPYDTLKDLVDAAKRNPEKLKLATHGLLGNTHLDAILFEKATGTKFAMVHLNGTSESMPNLVGGHVDAVSAQYVNFMPQIKGGEAKALGAMASENSPLFPDIPTMRSLGYDLESYTAWTYFLPAATPRGIVDVLSATMKKVIDTEPVKKKLNEMGMEPSYMGPDELSAYWDRTEKEVAELYKSAKSQ